MTEPRDDDATVVRGGAGSGAESAAGEARPEAVDDATVVRPRLRPYGDADVEVDDATIVHPMLHPRQGTQVAGTAVGGAPGAATHGSAARGSVAMPVDEPVASSLSLDTGGAGLDPERRIGPVPGTQPWSAPPTAERGVRAGTPVVYGARPERLADARGGIDEVHRRLGDPPPAREMTVREGRSALPSMERRARRARSRTLLGFAAVVLVAVLGLWGVAALAFG